MKTSTRRWLGAVLVGVAILGAVAASLSGRWPATLMEKQVLVKGPYAHTVVVYRGVQRETYSCAPFCEPRVTLGDGQNFFGTNLTQTSTWIGQVQGASRALNTGVGRTMKVSAGAGRRSLHIQRHSQPSATGVTGGGRPGPGIFERES